MTDRIAIRDMGTALTSDSSASTVKTTSASNLYPTVLNPDGISNIFWFKYSEATGQTLTRFNDKDDTVDNLRINLETGTNKLFVWAVDTGGSGSVVYKTTQELNPGVWYRIGWTFQYSGTTGTAEIYVNGVLYGSGSKLSYAQRDSGNYKVAFTNTLMTFDSTQVYDRVLTSQEFADDYVNAITPTNPSLEWLFDEASGSTALDTSGNSNDGTISGAVYTSEVPFKSRVAKSEATHALSFDGVDDVVTTSSELLGTIGNTDSFAINFKFVNKASSYSSSDLNRFITTKYGAMSFRDSNYRFARNGGTDTVGAAIRTNIEIEVTAVFDGSSMYLYEDGVLIGKKTSVLLSTAYSNPDEIGANVSNSRWFDGDMWDVRIFNTALTSTEVSNLYYNNIVPQTNLVAEYFNSINTDGAGTVLTDSVGSNDGTISGATWLPLPQTEVLPSVIPHVLNYAAVTVDTTTIPSMGSYFTQLGNYTVQSKVYIRNIIDTEQSIWNSSTGGSNRQSLSLNGDSLAFQRYDGVGYVGAKSPVAMRPGWYDIVCVNTAGVVTLHVNGVLIDTTDANNYSLTRGDTTLYLGYPGATTNGTQGIDGLISNTKVWSQSLTTEQIYDLHHHNVVPTEGLVGNWNEISDDGATLIDNSGNSNDGTITGATRVTETLALGDVPREAIVPYVGSVSFDGVDDFVTTTATIHETLGSIRVRFLLREMKDFNTIFENAANGDDWECFVRGNGNLDFRTNGSSFARAENIQPNKWYDCVTTWSGTTAKIYVDGVLRDTATQLTSDTTPTSLILSGDTNISMNGLISDAKMWSNKALTTAEVEDLYLTNTTPYDNDPSVCVLNLEAKTAVLSGSSWRDVSGNDNHGAITGATLSSEAPSKARKVIDGNLLYNGDFAIAPYFVGAQTGGAKWNDGTVAASAVNDIYGWYVITGVATAAYSIIDKEFIIQTDATGRGRALSAPFETSTTAANVAKYGIPLKPNTSYTFSGYVKSVDATASAQRIDCILFNQDGTAISTETTSYMPAGDSEYTLQTVTFTTASNETHAVIKIGINTAGTVQTMTVKDLTLTEA
jgi:hypothetical protein